MPLTSRQRRLIDVSLREHKTLSELVAANTPCLFVSDEDGVDLLVRTLADINNNLILVVYDPGVFAVARGIQKGEKPSSCVETWKSYAREILDLYKMHNHRLVLVAVLTFTNAFDDSKSGLLTPYRSDVEKGLYQKSSVVFSALELTIASQALSYDTAAGKLDQGLEEVALDFSVLQPCADDAFFELAALKSGKGLLSRQVTNVRDELRDHIVNLQDASYKSIRSFQRSGHEQNVGSDKALTIGAMLQKQSPSKTDHSDVSIGIMQLSHVFRSEDKTYAHLEFSLRNVRFADFRWDHVRFKFCSLHNVEHIEFRKNEEYPAMFQIWPGDSEDQFGSYWCWPDDKYKFLKQLDNRNDQYLLLLIFKVLYRIIDQTLGLQEWEDKSEWLIKSEKFLDGQPKGDFHDDEFQS